MYKRQPCTAHGIPKGMSNCQNEMKRAVDAGYWHLYRYNPALKAEGKNPFVLDLSLIHIFR